MSPKHGHESMAGDDNPFVKKSATSALVPELANQLRYQVEMTAAKGGNKLTKRDMSFPHCFMSVLPERPSLRKGVKRVSSLNYGGETQVPDPNACILHVPNQSVFQLVTVHSED